MLNCDISARVGLAIADWDCATEDWKWTNRSAASPDWVVILRSDWSISPIVNRAIPIDRWAIASLTRVYRKSELAHVSRKEIARDFSLSRRQNVNMFTLRDEKCQRKRKEKTRERRNSNT